MPPLLAQQTIVAQFEELSAHIDRARWFRTQAFSEATALIPSYLNDLFGDWYAGVSGRLDVKRWERLAAVVEDVADGPHQTPTYVRSGTPFLTVLNIASGRIDFRDHKCITAEDHAHYQGRAKAERGDVLLSKDGTIGVPCLVDTDREFSFFVSVALIKPSHEVLDGEYLTWVLRTPYLQNRMKERSRGDMIRHLVLREIRDLTVPIPTCLSNARSYQPSSNCCIKSRV